MKRSLLAIGLFGALTYLIGALAYRTGEHLPHARTDELASRAVDNILLNRNRDRAICDLVRLQRYRSTPRYTVDECTTRKVRQLIGSPNDDVFGVTLEVSYLDGPRDAPFAGELVLFDREGFLIPVYAASNVLESRDGFFQYRMGGDWAIVHSIRVSAGNETAVQIISVVPLEREQRAALRVIIGAPVNSYDCKGFHWSWQARDVDGDLVPEIEIGPNLEPPGRISPRAVFRWSEDDGRYLGPDGSPRDGWLRIDAPRADSEKQDCCGNAAAKVYAETASNVEGFRQPCEPPKVFEGFSTIH